MANNNGHAQGRAAPALTHFTFVDSGITVGIRKIGPMTQQALIQQLRRERPEPQPPTVDTELGREENTADPAYARALDDWQRDLALELNARLTRLAALEADVTIDDAARQAIARKRRHMRAVGLDAGDSADLTEAENDRVFYILHVACASPDDLKEFGRAVRERSVPTEEAVAAHVATFSGDVSG